MDDVDSMRMEMVVFRIDLMNNWTDRHGVDRYKVDEIILLVYEAPKEG